MKLLSKCKVMLPHLAYPLIRMSVVLSVLLVVSGLGGCAQTIKVAYERQMPAGKDLKRDKKVETLAVLNFEGPSGSGPAMAELFSTKLVHGAYYKIVERERLNKILNEQKLGMTGMIDEKTAAQIGKLAGVQAIIVGKVIAYSVNDEPYTKTVTKSVNTGIPSQKCDSNGKCKNVPNFRDELVVENHHRRNGTVSVSQKVVHVESGEVVWAKNATEQYKYDTGDPPREGGFLSKVIPELGQSEALTSMLDKVSDELARSIQPHKMKEEGEFELGGKEVNYGIDLIKAGRVDEAIQHYESLVSRNSGNCSALYNVGVIHFQSNDFQKADASLRAAEKCDLKPRYTTAVGENKKQWDKWKLESQK